MIEKIQSESNILDLYQALETYGYYPKKIKDLLGIDENSFKVKYQNLLFYIKNELNLNDEKFSKKIRQITNIRLNDNFETTFDLIKGRECKKLQKVVLNKIDGKICILLYDYYFHLLHKKNLIEEILKELAMTEKDKKNSGDDNTENKDEVLKKNNLLESENIKK